MADAIANRVVRADVGHANVVITHRGDDHQMAHCISIAIHDGHGQRRQAQWATIGAGASLAHVRCSCPHHCCSHEFMTVLCLKLHVLHRCTHAFRTNVWRQAQARSVCVARRALSRRTSDRVCARATPCGVIPAHMSTRVVGVSGSHMHGPAHRNMELPDAACMASHINSMQMCVRVWKDIGKRTHCR
jgi:hypothetical protein